MSVVLTESTGTPAVRKAVMKMRKNIRNTSTNTEKTAKDPNTRSLANRPLKKTPTQILKISIMRKDRKRRRNTRQNTVTSTRANINTVERAVILTKG